MVPDPQVLLGGLFIGALYGLSAMGFQFIMATTGEVCLAYGHLWAVAALLASTLLAIFVMPLWMIFLGLPAIGFVLGWAGHPARIWRRAGTAARSRAFFLATLGLALIIEDWGARLWPLPATALAWAPPPWQIAGVVLPPFKVLGVACVVALALALSMGLRQRRWGYALRAWDYGRGPTWLAGVDPCLTGRLALGLGLAIAGVAGGFLAFSYTISIQEGLTLTLRCLVIAVLAGVLSPWRVLAVALVIGVGEALVGHWAGAQWAPALSYLLLLAAAPMHRESAS